MKTRTIKILCLAILMSLSTSITSFAGWTQDNTGWKYQNNNGSFQKNGWYSDNGKWYYFNNKGYMQTGWMKYNSYWYYLNSSGSMKTGWLQDNGAWYYLRSDGVMQTGWLLDGAKWYYLSSDGTMQTGWLLDGGKWYYLKSDGAMAVNTSIDGYYVDSTGVRISSDVSFITSNVARSWPEIVALSDVMYQRYYGEITTMLTDINQIRAEVGKPALILDETLTKEAIARAVHMISYGYFHHYYDSVLQIDVTDPIYNIQSMAENIAYRSNRENTATLLTQMWKASADHYPTMVGNYTKVGIGYVPNDTNLVYGVQLFN